MSTVKAIWMSALACLMVATTACTSDDKHRFYSTADLPTNVVVYDPLADKPLWVKEIPVDHMLELDFDRHKEQEWKKVQLRPATRLTWDLYNDPDLDPIASDTVVLPGTPVIIKVNYRPAPELKPN